MLKNVGELKMEPKILLLLIRIESVIIATIIIAIIIKLFKEKRKGK